VSWLSFEVHKRSPKQPSVTVQERLSTLLSWDEGARPQTELTDCVSQWDGLKNIQGPSRSQKNCQLNYSNCQFVAPKRRAKREDPSPEVVQSLRGKL
jgi:hypothetical protein